MALGAVSRSTLSTNQILTRHDWLVGVMGLRYVLEERAYFLGHDRVVEAPTMIGLLNESKFRAAVRRSVEAIREIATMTVIP